MLYRMLMSGIIDRILNLSLKFWYIPTETSRVVPS